MKKIPGVEAQESAFIPGNFFVPTIDPYIFIEEEYIGYVRYRNITTGRRWEVYGQCDYRGDCLIGAVNPILGKRETRLDVPVSPEFNICCGKDIFTYKELPKVGEIGGN